MQKNIRELQMNLASAQARHKEDAQKLEVSQAILRQSQTRVTALEQKIASKNALINRTEQKIQALKEDINYKQIEVCNFADHLKFLKYVRHCSIVLHLFVVIFALK